MKKDHVILRLASLMFSFGMLSVRGGEVSYLETFEATPFQWVTLTQPSGYVDWPNGALSSARANGAVRLYSSFPVHNTNSPFNSLKSICLTRDGEIKTNRDLVISADILRIGGTGAFAALGWQQNALYQNGYMLLKGTDEIGLVKLDLSRKKLVPFFWEQTPGATGAVTMELRFSASEEGVSIGARLLDRAANSQVLFERTVVDTADADQVVAAPAPLLSGGDPGVPWQGSGRLTLGILGANSAVKALEIEADNFGMNQTREVTETDFLPLVYRNAAGREISYRLFVPALLDPEKKYPLVFYLHGAEGAGKENLKQFSHPGLLVFASPENQAKNPCFIAAPQFTVEELNSSVVPWTLISDKFFGLLTNLTVNYPIDSDRVYLTGISLGAAGTWSYLTGTRGGLFAGGVTMAGFTDPSLLRRIIGLPLWIFHGALDKTIPPEFNASIGRGSRILVNELRRLGSCPIYTEFSLAGHDIFDSAFETRGMVDWLMAQRRGVSYWGSPWISLVEPSTNSWSSSYTNLTLAGTSLPEIGVTNVSWRNHTRTVGQWAEGTTNWFASNVALRAGQAIPGGISVSTNIITITGTAPSGSFFFEGTTTFNTALQVLQVPIKLIAVRTGPETVLNWSGSAPGFVVQKAPDLNSLKWEDLLTTTETNHLLPPEVGQSFYRIKLP